MNASSVRRGNAVGQLTGRQREQQEREELRQADKPEVERVLANRVDLPADRDDAICIAKAR